MSALAPASLESNALALRLRELAGEERIVQVDFLLHLALAARHTPNGAFPNRPC
jgi:hypothetical protein